jgi:hypothetical protein
MKFEIAHSIFMPLGGVLIGFCNVLLKIEETRIYGFISIFFGILFISIPSYLKWSNK